MKPLLLFLLLLLLPATSAINLSNRVISAVNCGGPETLGAYGILYSEDPSDSGVSSDAGRAFSFSNAEDRDVEIYQTERWSKESFSYEIPVSEDGDYVIILKFSEVYFERPDQKVFNVKINSKTVVKNLDIFEKSGGRGFAHDMLLHSDKYQRKKISVSGQSKDYRGKIVIELAKGANDNPKINGFVVLRGGLEGLPEPPEKFVASERFREDFDMYENDIIEEYVKPQVIQDSSSEVDPESEEMFTATTGSENPFEQESSMDSLLLPVISAFIIIIPVAYVFQMRYAHD
uniref:Malectin domain-containing protein n=1 Tax=Caenorhabditis tropicalis TaxID=1561998 RepID=A0A1I7UUX7_9PELO